MHIVHEIKATIINYLRRRFIRFAVGYWGMPFKRIRKTIGNVTAVRIYLFRVFFIRENAQLT